MGIDVTMIAFMSFLDMGFLFFSSFLGHSWLHAVPSISRINTKFIPLLASHFQGLPVKVLTLYWSACDSTQDFSVS